jgi:hypothetical protein
MVKKCRVLSLITDAFISDGMTASGTFETSTDVRYAAAFGGNADISQWLPDNRDL